MVSKRENRLRLVTVAEPVPVLFKVVCFFSVPANVQALLFLFRSHSKRREPIDHFQYRVSAEEQSQKPSKKTVKTLQVGVTKALQKPNKLHFCDKLAKVGKCF